MLLDWSWFFRRVITGSWLIGEIVNKAGNWDKKIANSDIDLVRNIKPSNQNSNFKFYACIVGSLYSYTDFIISS